VFPCSLEAGNEECASEISLKVNSPKLHSEIHGQKSENKIAKATTLVSRSIMNDTFLPSCGTCIINRLVRKIHTHVYEVLRYKDILV